MKLALITCTGDRPEAFELCRKFVKRSTVQPDQWIIVDDGRTPITRTSITNALCVRREPQADDPPHTLAVNLLAAVKHLDAAIDWVVFWEDDDWYSPMYLEWLLAQVEDHPSVQLIGQSYAQYYRLMAREYQILENNMHASLCATAMHVSLLKELVYIAEHTADPFIDMHLWKRNSLTPQSHLLLRHPHVIGIKQLPGRQGRTYGWRGGEDFLSDETCRVLRMWVGAEDAAAYRRICAKGNMK